MRLSVNYSVPIFKRLFNRARKSYEDAFREALKAQVLAIAEAVPVYSGESRASLTEAARLARVSIIVIPAPGVKSKVAEGRGKGKAQLTISRTSFTFEIDSEVLQLRINDEFDASKLHPNFRRLKKPGPYNLNAVGNAAFSAALTANLKNVVFTVERRTIKNG